MLIDPSDEALSQNASSLVFDGRLVELDQPPFGGKGRNARN